MNEKMQELNAKIRDESAFVETLTTENRIRYDRNFLVTKFNMFQFFEPSFFPISFFYLGNVLARHAPRSKRQLCKLYGKKLERLCLK